MAGGILEYTSLIISYRSLLVMIAIPYRAAFVFGRRHFEPGIGLPVETKALVSTS